MVMEGQLDRLTYYSKEYDYYINRVLQLINKPIIKLKQKMENTPVTEKTFGQQMVGINFNPSADSAVDRIKQICANAIDEINTFRTSTESHKAKNFSEIAIENLMTGQMWAVKAVTWKD